MMSSKHVIREVAAATEGLRLNVAALNRYIVKTVNHSAVTIQRFNDSTVLGSLGRRGDLADDTRWGEH